MKYLRSAAAEFPNDNTELHDGALWVRSSVLGRAKALVRPATLAEGDADEFELDAAEPEPEPDLEIDIEVDVSALVESALHEAIDQAEAEAGIVAEAEVPELVIAAAVAPLPEVPVPVLESVPVPVPVPVPAPDPTPAPVGDPFADFVMATVRIALDAGATRAAAALPVLLGMDQLSALVADATLCDRLVAAKLATRAGTTLELATDLAAKAAAWRAVLRNESDDLAACGDATLDEWAASLLVRLLEAPTDRLRELKRELRRQGVAAFGMVAVAA